MGVATSGSMLFRQVGGSIGVALFGAIFANRLRGAPADDRAQLPRSATRRPSAISRRRSTRPYVHAFALALQPVFLVGAAVGIAAFALTWLLREVPLRTAQSAGEAAGETFGLEEAA